MNLAIMTIQGQNLGNRLQNYALQTVLNDFGHDVVSLRRDPGIRGDTATKIRYIKSRLGCVCHRSDRVAAFRRFDSEHIRMSRFVASNSFTSSGLAGKFDAFVIGSDQIWNPCVKASRWVGFLPDIAAGKKLSYAASFGVKWLDAEDWEPFGRYLQDIKCLSVREDAGVEIIRSVSGREATLVLDPTLLLSADRWQQIAQRPLRVPDAVCQGYCLKYFLGDEKEARTIEQLAKSKGLELVDVLDFNLAIGPAEFIWLVQHAALVCTDSFHGTIFSLLFHKPFVLFERHDKYEDMSSRFDTLNRQFDVLSHQFGSSSFDEFHLELDVASFEAKRNELRSESLRWMRSALAGMNV